MLLKLTQNIHQKFSETQGDLRTLMQTANE